MSVNTSRTSLLTSSLLTATLFVVLASGAAQAATAPASRIDCASPVPLTPGETWRDPGAWTSTACFAVRIDRAGLLAAELSMSAIAPGAHLTLLDAEASDSTRLQRSATTLILAAEPGTYRLEVRTDDPSERLGPFRLWLDLAESQPSPSLRRAVGRDEDDSELEIEPDPLTGLCPTGTVLNPVTGLCKVVTGTGGPSKIRPLGPSGLKSLCQRAAFQDARDDHRDTFSCATALAWGAELRGALGNDWGDDRDVFRFGVPSLQPVEIAARVTDGNGEIVAELYDRYGQRLERIEGESAGARTVRTLVPGTYFVRLEGRDHAPGSYSLQVGSPR